MEEYVFPICGGLFIILFFALGVYMVFTSFRNRKKAAESSGWPTVVGTIIKATIKKNRSTDSEGYTSTTYTPKIEYQYNLGGQVYTGKRIAFGFDKSYNRRKKAQEALAAYQPNAQVRVFYNPDNPAEAVLEQKASGSIGGIIGGVVLILVAVCVGCPALGIYLWNNF